MNAYEWVALILAILVILAFIIGAVFIYLYTPIQWWVLLIMGIIVFMFALAIIMITISNANIMGTAQKIWDKAKEAGEKAKQAVGYGQAKPAALGAAASPAAGQFQQ
jgi:uncharacterized membrane protein